MAATWRGVPSRRRRPQAESSRRHLGAFGRVAAASRERPAGGLNTPGRWWRCRGRVRATSGHGRGRERSEKTRRPKRWRRKVLAATFLSWSRDRQYWRRSSARRSCGASGWTAALEHAWGLGASPRRCRSASRRRRSVGRALLLFVWSPILRQRSTRTQGSRAAPREGSKPGSCGIGGTTQQPTAQRFRSTLEYVEIFPHNLPDNCTKKLNLISPQVYLYGNFSAS
jgi:hypothetical protein